MAADVTIIGAGLAGLTCARRLIAEGVQVEVLEAGSRVGGRVRTDQVEGFLLDRGFQVLLTAYQECQRWLDYPKLDLKSFYPGAMIWFAGKFHNVADPWRKPLDAIGSVASPIGTLIDKARVGSLRTSVMQGSVEELFERPEMSTLAALQSRHFSDSMINRFFRPFFGGIFLDRTLLTSSRLFEFIFRMFAEGDIAIPTAGMEEISRQLGRGVPVKLETRVSQLADVESRTVVIATEGVEAARLLGAKPPDTWRSVRCFYFAADCPPVKDPILMLNGESQGPVNNFCVESNVASTYALPGAALLSASVLGTASEQQVREHLQLWFGPQVERWQHLRTYDVNYAQPDQTAPALTVVDKPVRIRKGLYICGDHVETASLQGAMRSGRRAAEAIITDR